MTRRKTDIDLDQSYGWGREDPGTALKIVGEYLRADQRQARSLRDAARVAFLFVGAVGWLSLIFRFAA